MLRQDQSVYCEHNSANTFNTLNDVAFKDTHATVNVPGDAWQLPSPKPAVGGLLTMEDTVQDMMETLQHILGDNNFTESLDVEPDELKCWETMLLKMSNTNCDMGEELNDILNNDILTYVEEQLQKDGGLKLPDQLNDACLSTLDLHNQNPDQVGEQSFGWPIKPQNQLVPNKGQITDGQMTPSLGIMKLTHMNLPSDSGLRGPTLQHIVSHQASVGLGNIGSPVTLNPSLVDSCTQAQNQLRALQVNTNDHNLGTFRQTNQTHTNQMAQPTQNPLRMRTSNLSVDFQDQSAQREINPMFNIQGNQLNSSVQADTFVGAYSQNISTQPGFTSEPPLSSCLQGHFALQTQNNDNQRQSLQQQQQLISSDPQQMAGCLNPMSGFQGNSVLGAVAPKNPIQIMPMFSTPEMSNATFTTQEDLELPPLGSSRSCMFSNTTPSVPVNGMHLSQAPSCQRINLAGNEIPSKFSCFYLPEGESVKGMVAIQNPNEVAPSCQMTTGLDTNGLMVQQQYVNFSDQTQVKKTL